MISRALLRMAVIMQLKGSTIHDASARNIKAPKSAGWISWRAITRERLDLDVMDGLCGF